MCALKQATGGQLSLGEFGTGNIVSLDGGKRLRLDEKVDFWPGTGTWSAIDTDQHGVGVTSMLEFLMLARAQAGQPVPRWTPLQSDRNVVCENCEQPAELHLGPAVYPDRNDLAERQFWVCWSCDAWVGCHKDSDKPFGALANEELRNARIAAHASFDPVWQDDRMSRPAAYDWLSRVLGIPRERCHIGMMTLSECQRVNQVVWERFGVLRDAF